MSNQVSDQTVEGSAQTSEQQTTKDNVAYDTHRKLLGEKKQVQSQLQEAMTRLETLEQEKLSAEGKKDELITTVQKKLTEANDKLKKVVGAFQYRAVSNKFVEKARAEGCLKPEKLMQLADLSQIEVDVDNDFSVSDESVSSIIEGLKKEVPFFFQKNNITVIDQVPGNINSQVGPQDLTKKSMDELMALAKTLDKRG
jgi:uncharacterized protein YjbJ (UPF0337 family)